MYKLKVILLLFIFCYGDAYANNNDSLFVKPKGEGWVIIHNVKRGETIFSVSRRFHVPPAVLSGETGLSYQASLDNIGYINVPVGPYNFVKNKPVDMSDARPIYYRVKDENDIYRISRYSSVPQHVMQQWNNLPDNAVERGQTLFVGWVLYDATQSMPDENVQVQPTGTAGVAQTTTTTTTQTYDKNTHIQVIKIALPDTTKRLTPEEETFNAETDNGQNVVTENGRAVFFESVTHDNVFYAFHNGTPRNRIIKVVNPENGKVIYVKVIGALPEIKLYANSVIGITSAAKDALGVQDDKVFVDLSYAQ